MTGNYRPTLSSRSALSLVQNIYGLKVNVVRELNSYDDQNFLVEVVHGSSLPSNVKLASPHGYVFKILNCLDSMQPEVVETMTEIILHANTAGYPTPGLIPTVDGHYQKLLSLPSSKAQDDKLQHYVVRLFNFIPDQTLDQVTLTPQLCYEVGWFAGKLDIVLKGFPTVENSVFPSITRKWSMSQIPKLRDKLSAITSQEQRRIAKEIIDQFETAVLSSQHMFSKGLIHGDFNDCNILVNHDDHNHLSMMQGGVHSNSVSTVSAGNINFNTSEKSCLPQYVKKNISENSKDRTSNNDDSQLLDDQPWHVSGVIDFGDTTLSLYVFEVAIAIAYTMINKHGIPAVEAGSFVLSGYLEHISLTQNEINFLKLCVCARLVQSLVLGYFSVTQDTENNYILTHAERVWPVLQSLWKMPDSQVVIQFMKHATNHSRS